ncbi:MAG: glycosyltransferase family 4 protein [Burkholderiales bacterium]|nr:glycosyltransferase family 4 protein [Burkholderiales bacterium]
MLPRLREAGYDPAILFEPAAATQAPTLDFSADRVAAEGWRIVCFQKVGGPSVLAMVRELKARGIKTVFVVCDLVDEAMARATDATVVVTDYLKSLYPRELHSRIHVIHDGIERPEVAKAEWRDDAGSRARPLRAVLVTSAPLERLPVLGTPPTWLEVAVVGRYRAGLGAWARLRKAQWRLRQHERWSTRLEAMRFMASGRIHCLPWHPDGVYEQLRRADIGIIPVDTTETRPGAAGVPDWQVKSENRLTLKMAIGLPVIATPIPAYEPVVAQGVNGFLASDGAQWARALAAMRDPRLRREIGAKARQSVLEGYSQQRQASAWVDLIENSIAK